jgi:hypothetical protein
MKRITPATFVILTALLTSSPYPAQAAPLPDAEVKSQLAALQAAVDRMQQRITALEALVPSFTGFMPDFSERFHVMHAAGDAEDWAVADHELKEMQRMLSMANVIDPEKGKLMSAMLSHDMASLESAIQHRSQQRFRKALNGTVVNCNACHVASGSPFIQVTLDVPDGLSMRHPHQFSASKPLTSHTHGH